LGSWFVIGIFNHREVPLSRTFFPQGPRFL
jgi:hypothetical protein